jgi:protein TonB
MFGGFEEQKDAQAGKRWFASAGTSLVIFVLGAIALVILAKQTSASPQEAPSIDVTFHAEEAPEPEKAPPPPPPPPPTTEKKKAKRPGKVAPVQPSAIPEARPDEAEPGERVDATALQEEFGDGEVGTELPTASAPPPPPPPPPPAAALDVKIPDPVSEVDPGVKPPRAAAGNAMPVYPEKMRHKGVEAEVIIKIKISAKGEVIAAEVIRGDEPFASAALAAVKTWRYEPATVDGRPAPFVRLVKLPFRLK